MNQLPRIKKALDRAITHETKSPGELAEWLTYLSMQAAWRSVEKDRKGVWNDGRPEAELNVS